jgi:hypothetical protein
MIAERIDIDSLLALLRKTANRAGSPTLAED